MVRCSRCGAKNPATAQGCLQCGAELPSWQFLPLASIGRRWVALVIDSIIVQLMSYLMVFALSASVAIFLVVSGVPEQQWDALSEGVFWWLAFFLGLLLQLVYYTLFWGLFGWSPGKWLLGLRVVRTDRSPVGLKRAFLRAIGYYVSSLPVSLGFLSALWDDSNQTWHDKIADTYVVRI